MFFYLSKILSGLFFPLPALLLLLGGVCVFYRRRLARPLLVLATVLIYALSLYPVAGALMSVLESRSRAVPVDQMPSADAIILLGGMVNPTIRNRPGEPEFIDSVDRLFLAESLLRHNKAPLLLISGGSGFLMQQEASEAVLLKRFLVDRGYPEARILAEDKSRNTYENARNTALIAQKRGIKRILLVTSAFHMLRSRLCFEAQGFEVIAAPADFYYTGSKNLPVEAVFPAPVALRLSTIAFKEYVGLVAYYLAGYFDKAVP